MQATMTRTILARVAMTLLVALILPLMGSLAWAGDVTPQQAQQLAQKFLKNRKNNAGGPLYAPGAAPQLTLRTQVSGLYVFNVSNNRGYVIVSNDDRTVPILGYSDSGSFDPDQMPDNMRAWLQGYADEIAWLKQQNVENTNNPYASNTPRQSNRAAKVPIAPLVVTQWNQSDPYDNLTPYYKEDGGSYYYSKDKLAGYEHCATGCVATAMAQVMKFWSWPTAACAEVPGYKWSTSNINLPALSAKVFDWANMKNKYTGGETNEEKTAVATLMQYCGWSVQMDYGPSSGSNTNLVADALKAYFDYKSTTTQFVQRSFYTYANWIELMYDELSKGRPIVYGGMSSGGGHEFVCDGYEGEDYFHINWGWGGMSDNYFKLSALDPDAQGIGGSSSTDGFHYGQDAVIGIQPSTGTGTVAVIPTNTVNLALNGVTFSASPTQYQEVTVNIDLKNNSSDPYDGDIGIRVYYKNSGTWYYVDDVSSDFLISASSASTVCQIKFLPEYSGTYGVKVYRPSETPGYIYWVGYTNANDQTPVTVAAGEGDPDLDLTFGMPTIESPWSLVKMSPKVEVNLYGTRLKGSLGIMNNNGTAYFGEVGWELYKKTGGSLEYVASHYISNVTLAAGETKQVSMDFSGLEIGETYYLYGVWSVGSGSNWDYVIINTKPAILTYAADGTETFVKPSGTSYTAPDGALVVDVSGTGITSITPNAQPNAIYIYSGSKPSGIDGKNLVEYTAGIYHADKITLADGAGFYSPVDIEADLIEFNYAFTTGADGTNGWNTIMLPFEAEAVTADDASIDWFHSSTDTGRNFWLKKFVNDDATHVYFDYVSDFALEPNTPYIIAFPGDKWGAAWDMSGKAIKFIGTGLVSRSDAMSSITGANYRFIGSTIQDNTENIYCLNALGNKFELVTSGGSGPFRAYFKPGTFDSSITSLGIGSDDTTGLSEELRVKSLLLAGTPSMVCALTRSPRRRESTFIMERRL